MKVKDVTPKFLRGFLEYRDESGCLKRVTTVGRAMCSSSVTARSSTSIFKTEESVPALRSI